MDVDGLSPTPANGPARLESTRAQPTHRQPLRHFRSALSFPSSPPPVLNFFLSIFFLFFARLFLILSPPPPPRAISGCAAGMQRRWQVWGKPDGSLVWVPASDGPPPPAAAASEAPLPRPDPQPAATELGEARSGDAIPEGSVSPSLSLSSRYYSFVE